MVQKQSNRSESPKQKSSSGGAAKKPSLNLGDLCNLKITALGANNIGIDEYSYASSVLVPFAKLGDTVQAKIVKIQVCDIKKKTIKFAIAKTVLKVDALVSKIKIGSPTSNSINVQAGAKLAVPISSFSESAIAVAELENNYKIFVINSNPSPSWAPVSFSEKSGEPRLVDIQITRVKAKYAFAKLINNVTNYPFFNHYEANSNTNITPSNKLGDSSAYLQQKAQLALTSEGIRDWKIATNNILGGEDKPTTFKNLALFNKAASFRNSKLSLKIDAPESEVKHSAESLTKSSLASINADSFKTSNISLDTLVREGNKLTLVLPNKVKQYDCLPNYVVMKLSNTVFFIKLALGATLGNRVKIKLTKVLENNAYAEGMPLPEEQLASTPEGYIPQGDGNLIKIAIAKVIALNPISFTKKRIMVKSAVCQMLNSGMHFGEKAVKCHARMKNYVWLRQKGQNKNKPLIKKGRNIINLLKTRRCLNKSLLQLSKYAAKGRTFLFVGTKKPAAALIARASLFSKTSFFVNTRWLGGMLTNWKTILKSIAKVRPILKEKQIIIKEILTKRQNLKNRLISKAILLKKKSKMLLKKGQNVLKAVSNASNLEQNKLFFKEKNQKLTLRTQQLVKKSGVLLQTRQQLLAKKHQLINQSSIVKENVSLITNKYKALINQVTLNRKKLIELKSLFVIAKQIQKIKMSSLDKSADLSTNLLTLCYAQFKRFNSNSMVIPNPPSNILNKIVLTIRDATSGKSSGANLTGVLSTGGITEKNEKIVLISGLLSKFSLFIPHVRECIKVVCANIVNATQTIKMIKQTLAIIKQKVNLYANLKIKINYQLQKIKISILIERQTLSLVKRKLKQLSSEIRLLKFLPKLRYLSTPYSPMYSTVQVLMKKIVDPKLKYPMNLIYDQKLSLKSKKVVAARKKTWQRLEKYFGGIANMTKMKSNKIAKNVAILVGQKEEQNAVRECKKLGIKMFSIIDTNCNPSLADHFVTANDDSRNSIKYILTKFLTRIRLAQKISLNVKKLARLTK